MTAYAIEFRFPTGAMYAGLANGAFGWAPTLKTALMYENADDAQRVIRNGYGEASAEYAYVVEVKAGHRT